MVKYTLNFNNERIEPVEGNSGAPCIHQGEIKLVWGEAIHLGQLPWQRGGSGKFSHKSVIFLCGENFATGTRTRPIISLRGWRGGCRLPRFTAPLLATQVCVVGHAGRCSSRPLFLAITFPTCPCDPTLKKVSPTSLECILVRSWREVIKVNVRESFIEK